MNNKIMKMMLWFNNAFINKKFRTYVALFSIAQGLFRLNVIDGIINPRLLFGTNLIFGLLLLFFGTALLITTFTMRDKYVISKLIIVLLAALYSILGVAVIGVSTVSAIGTFLITIVLLIEACVIYER